MGYNLVKSYRKKPFYVSVSAYENTTNLPGARFLTSNLRCGPIKLYVKLDTVPWYGDYPHNKQIEVDWMIRIFGKHRSLSIKAAW